MHQVLNPFLNPSPLDFHDRATGRHVEVVVAPCPLGVVLIATLDEKICEIALGDDAQSLYQSLRARDRYRPGLPKYEGDAPGKAGTAAGTAVEITAGTAAASAATATAERHAAWIAAIVRFIENPSLGLSLPLAIRGTAFQQRTWQALQTIPLSTTISYTELARRIGAPTAVRAVANACARNPLALVIPCHRVIRQDGSYGGYRWNIARKRELLAREFAAIHQ